MTDFPHDHDELDEQNETLVQELRQRSQQFGRVPAQATTAAMAAFAMAGFDDKLATLLIDSADQSSPVGVRSASAEVRLLRFDVGAGELQIGLAPGYVSGTLTGRSERTVDVVTPSYRRSVEIDEFGDFAVAGVEAGPLRLEIGVGAERVVTDWLLLPRY
jgi:hypothetical protein